MYMSEQTYEDKQPPSEYENTYYIAVLQNNTRLPIDSWSKLSQDDTLMQMKLPRESKALKLGLKPPPNNNNIDTRKSIFHNISVFDQHEAVPSTDESDTILANATSI